MNGRAAGRPGGEHARGRAQLLPGSAVSSGLWERSPQKSEIEKLPFSSPPPNPPSPQTFLLVTCLSPQTLKGFGLFGQGPFT